MERECDAPELTPPPPVRRLLKTLKQRRSTPTHSSSSTESTSRRPYSPDPQISEPPPGQDWSWLNSTSLFDCGTLLELTGDEADGVSLGGVDWMETLGGLEGIAGGYVGDGSLPPVESGLPSYRDAPTATAPPTYSTPASAPLFDFAIANRRPATLPFPFPAAAAFPTTPPPPHINPHLSLMPVITTFVLLPQIEAFFERMQPVLPIFPRAYLLDRINRGDHLTDVDFAAMIISLSSFSLMQLVEGDETVTRERTVQAKALMGEATTLQASMLLGQAPTLDAVLTSFFLFGSLCESCIPFCDWSLC